MMVLGDILAALGGLESLTFFSFSGMGQPDILPCSSLAETP